MKRFPAPLLFGLLAALVFATGCHDDNSPTSPPRDSLALQSVVPATGTNVPKGQSTHFTAVLRHEFAIVTRGRIVVLVRASWRSVFEVESQTLAQLGSRTGETTVSVDIAIPSTAGGGILDLEFGLIPEDGSMISASSTAHYGVAS